MKVEVVYEDDGPIEITNYGGGPRFTFVMEGSTAVLEEPFEWTQISSDVTFDRVDEMDKERRNILAMVRGLPFVEAIEGLEE